MYPYSGGNTSWVSRTKPAHEFWENDYSDESDEDDIIGQLTKAKNEEIIRTRNGYIVSDVIRGLYQVMADNGAIAGGRLLHYTADLICSGGFPLWEKFLYDYSLEHIGIASPRVFVYLSKRLGELGAFSRSLPDEEMWRQGLYQKRVAEIALVLKDCPRRGKPKIPKIDAATHRNQQWIHNLVKAPESTAVRKVWRVRADMDVLRIAGNEIAAAITDGATEKALYWLKWLVEEEVAFKKEFIQQMGNTGKKGAAAAVASVALTTVERGPPGLKGNKRVHVGYYIAELLAEIYKDLAGQSLIRMHEEFQALLNLYRSSVSGLSSRRKLDTLCLMVQICSEVPRWKIPAAPVLVKDSIVLQRMCDQAPTFFSEILQHPALAKPLGKKGTKAPKAAKPIKDEDKTSSVDSAMEAYFARIGAK